jgi:hypothetical protein
MITVRQIERDWNARNYEKLFRELTAARPEAKFCFDFEGGRAAPAAAMGIIRLAELNQSFVPLYAKLVRAVLACQDARDGGWGDVVVTALCLRALLSDKGHGVAVDRGMAYLADLQKPEGIWPAVPVRRLPEDPYTSAFLLSQLGDQPRFREAVRFDDAVGWFERHTAHCDEETRAIWERASLRCASRRIATSNQPLIWTE